MCEIMSQKILQDEQCFEIIRKKLRQDAMDDFSLIDYKIVPIGEVNGYVGQYFILKATVACPKSPMETKNINFFTKIPPPTKSPLYDFVQEYGLFKKEVALYTTVFPKIRLDNHNGKCIPEFFLGVGGDVIVLEDMVHSGYTMANKFTPFDFEHCKILMKTLAKFHAKSFIFEQQCKKTLHDKFSYCMHETLWPQQGTAKPMFDAAVKGIVSMIDLLSELNDDQRSMFKKKILRLCKDHTVKLLPSVKHKNVLCHGDLWANNLMFKYDANNQPVECCLVDFQLARYNPPAHDILCFLQFSTTRKLRENHGKTLFKIYHDSMAAIMMEAGLNISEVFSWDEFIESIQDLRIMCMIHGVLNTPIMLLDSDAVDKYFAEEPKLLESILHVDRTPLICEQFNEIPKYRARMIDGLLELYDYIIGDK